MKILITILLLAVFFSMPGASSFAESVTLKAIVSNPISISASRYTNNGDGTVTDNVTKLEWVASPAAAGLGGTYIWAGAITACNSLNSSNYAGHSDWRLPNIKELMSIVDHGRSSPAIDPLFTCVSDFYWSSTALVIDTTYKWRVLFDNGKVYWSNETTSSYYVRPVRGG